MKISEQEMLKKLASYSTPELCDGAGLFHAMDYQIKPYVGKKIAGMALTFDGFPGDGGAVPDAILKLLPGRVLVIAGAEAKRKTLEAVIREMKETGRIISRIRKMQA